MSRPAGVDPNSAIRNRRRVSHCRGRSKWISSHVGISIHCCRLRIGRHDYVTDPCFHSVIELANTRSSFSWSQKETACGLLHCHSQFSFRSPDNWTRNAFGLASAIADHPLASEGGSVQTMSQTPPTAPYLTGPNPSLSRTDLAVLQSLST